MKSKRYPNDSETTKGPYSITSSTNKLNLRARGRSFQCKWYSDTTDVSMETWYLESNEVKQTELDNGTIY